MRPAVDTLRERLQRVRDFSQALARPLDLEELFHTLHQEVAGVLKAPTFFLGLYDEASRTIEVVRQTEFDAELPGGTFPLGKGVTSEVIQTRQPRLIHQWSHEAAPVQVQYLSSTPGLPESALTVPLLFGDHVVGVMAVQDYRPNAFDEDDLLVFEAIAGQAASAITNLRQSHRLNAQLQRRISELQAILGTMADALLMVDAEGRLVGLNHAARALLCLNDTSVVLGQPLDREQWGQWPLGAGEIAETLAPMIKVLQRGEVPAEVEVHINDSGRRVLSFTGTVLSNARGAPNGSVLIVRDVTGPRKIEELKDEMLLTASHDLKTPLTLIRTDAQQMRRDIRNASTSLDQLDHGLASIVGQTERLSKLLSLLLDLSSIEAGRFTLNRTLVDLRSLALRVVAAAQATTEKHHLRLDSARRVMGYWDPQRLEQVLGNLLANAIKYSPSGGSIDVRLRAGRGSVTVSVKDEGVGLAPDEASHVFERFFRANKTRRLQGTGLGLYICAKVVTAHGGRIWVDSAGPGQGSSFNFVLPRREHTES